MLLVDKIKTKASLFPLSTKRMALRRRFGRSVLNSLSKSNLGKGCGVNQLSRCLTMESETEYPSTPIQNELISSFLTLETIDVNIFRAGAVNLWKPQAGRFVYGGQVVGQALVAASRTVSDDHHCHSLHCYFLKGGNPNRPILYHVDRTRDGSTFSSRNIKATQEGLAIFTMQASYKVEEQDVLQHQFRMPEVPPPEALVDSRDYLKSKLEDNNTPDHHRVRIMKYLQDRIHIEKRPVDPDVFHMREQGGPHRYLWIRAGGDIGTDLKLHQCVAGFISDVALLGAAIQPAPRGHKVGFMASLDHSMWFHNPFRADEWMLYEIESPQCGRGKALTLGRLWKRDGTLAISVAQEGVVRSATPVKEPIKGTQMSKL